MSKVMASTDALKEVLKAVADSEVLVSEIARGFSFREISQLIGLASDLPPIVRDASIMLPEWENLDDAARAELVDYIKVNCVCPNHLEIEVWVQKVLTAAVLLSSIFSVFAA